MTTLDLDADNIRNAVTGPPFFPLTEGETIVKLHSLTLIKGFRGDAYHAVVEPLSGDAGAKVGNLYTLRFTPFNQDKVKATIEMQKLRSFLAAVLEEDFNTFNATKGLQMLIEAGDVSAQKEPFKLKIVGSAGKTNPKTNVPYMNHRYESVE